MRRCNSVASSLAFGDKTFEVWQCCCCKSPLLLAILRYRRLPQMEEARPHNMAFRSLRLVEEI
jgi:hypothetical protein